MYCGDKIVPAEAFMMGSKRIIEALGWALKLIQIGVGQCLGLQIMYSTIHVDPFWMENRPMLYGFSIKCSEPQIRRFQSSVYWDGWGYSYPSWLARFSPSIPWQVWPVAKCKVNLSRNPEGNNTFWRDLEFLTFVGKNTWELHWSFEKKEKESKVSKVNRHAQKFLTWNRNVIDKVTGLVLLSDINQNLLEPFSNQLERALRFLSDLEKKELKPHEMMVTVGQSSRTSLNILKPGLVGSGV